MSSKTTVTVSVSPDDAEIFFDALNADDGLRNKVADWLLTSVGQEQVLKRLSIVRFLGALSAGLRDNLHSEGRWYEASRLRDWLASLGQTKEEQQRIGKSLLSTLAVALLVLTGCGSEPVKLVVDPTVIDVAVAYPDRREIRLNPVNLARVSPDFGSWILSHELGHVELQHRLSLDSSIRQQQELEADCWAAQHSTHEQNHAAIVFFNGSPWKNGELHPAGTVRAKMVALCAKEEGHGAGEDGGALRERRRVVVEARDQ